jgi:hypothetical protein
VQPLARELLGRPDIDERLAGVGVLTHLLEESADLIVRALWSFVTRRWIARDIRRESTVFLLPLDPPTIEQLGVGEPE